MASYWQAAICPEVKRFKGGCERVDVDRDVVWAQEIDAGFAIACGSDAGVRRRRVRGLAVRCRRCDGRSSGCRGRGGERAHMRDYDRWWVAVLGRELGWGAGRRY